MKKVLRNLLFVSAIGSVAFLYSCGAKEDLDDLLKNAPTIEVEVKGVEVTGTAIAAVEGDTAKFTVTVDAPGKFNTLNIKTSVDGVAAPVQTIGRNEATVTLTEEGKKAKITVSHIFKKEQIGKAISITFEGVDDKDKTVEETFTVTVKAASPAAKIQAAVLLYAATDDETSKTFYSIALDTTYSVNNIENTNGASATVDLGYFFVKEANLASPSSYSASHTGAYDLNDWKARRKTLMIVTTLKTEDVAKMTVAKVEAAVTNVDVSNKGAATIEGLTDGKIYAFETEDKLKGLIRVVKVDPGHEKGKSIELEFILAKAK